MTKKDYMKPSLKVVKLQHKYMILNNSVKTEGLGQKSLTQDNTPGNSWDEAMSRRHSEWDEEEEDW